MIKGLLVLIILLLAVNVAYIFCSPMVKNTMLEGKMHDLATERGLKGEVELRRDTMNFAHEKNIPLDEDQLVVTVADDGTASIAGHYTVDARFWFYDRHYEFYPASEASARLEPRRVGQQPRVRAGY